MFEDISERIKKVDKENTVFKETIKKLVKEDKIYASADVRYNHKTIFKPFTNFENHPDEIKEEIEKGATYLEYAPWIFSKTETLLKESKSKKIWKIVPGQELPDTTILYKRISFYQIGIDEITNSSYGFSYGSVKSGTTVRLRKISNKLMLLLFNKNGTFDIFRVDEPKIDSINDEDSEHAEDISSNIKEYNSGVYAKFYPLNTALLIEGILNSKDTSFKEKIKQIVDTNPSSTFSCIYNFVVKNEVHLSQKLEDIFKQMGTILSGKYFNINKKDDLIEIKNNAINYFEPYSRRSNLAAVPFNFAVKTMYRKDLEKDYILESSSENGLEFVKEKREHSENHQEQVYDSIFPEAIIFDTNLGIGVKFAENYIFGEENLIKRCKEEKDTSAYTSGILNMYRNIENAINEKINTVEHSLNEVANLLEYENLFVENCTKIDNLNVEPMKTTYLLTRI